MVENQTEFLTPGIPDEEFIRGNVPMTKEEVREISICKLRLTQNSVFFDVGSGTGSIAVEAAKLSKKIRVFAFEENPQAVSLINQNCKKFGCDNVQIVAGMAPETFASSCVKEVVPTHAFIGGTKGQLLPVLQALYTKNPAMRIVINAVTMESICGIQTALESGSLPVTNLQTVQVAVNRANPVGNYHLLQANNPVFIFAFNFCPSAAAEAVTAQKQDTK